MADKAASAAREKHLHPEKTYKQLSIDFKIPISTINDRATGRHSSHKATANAHLSMVQETALVNKINDYGSRGLPLTPAMIKELAEDISGERSGRNWGSTFFRRHKSEISSKHYEAQELSRIEADTPANRKAFYDIIKAKLDSGVYLPCNMYNMDEAGFDLVNDRKVRRVAPRKQPRKAHAVPAAGEHISVIACIGIDRAIVPPVVIYKGKSGVMEDWHAVKEQDVWQLMVTTESGWSNSYITLEWLRTVFDPATKLTANNGRDRRLLFLDNSDIHVKVDLFEACWERNIDLVILPAKLTGKLQPLDVDFFNNLKGAYNRHFDRYLLGSSLGSIPKGVFFGFHQKAWRETATARQIRGAWAKSGLVPLDYNVMVLDIPPQARQRNYSPATPPPIALPVELDTPENVRMLHQYRTKLRRGEISPTLLAEKTTKTAEKALAQVALLEAELDLRKASQAVDRAARSTKKKEIYPVGAIFDPFYQAEHAEELAARKEREREVREKKRQTVGARRKRQRSNSVESCIAGPSGTS